MESGSICFDQEAVEDTFTHQFKKEAFPLNCRRVIRIVILNVEHCRWWRMIPWRYPEKRSIKVWRDKDLWISFSVSSYNIVTNPCTVAVARRPFESQCFQRPRCQLLWVEAPQSTSKPSGSPPYPQAQVLQFLQRRFDSEFQQDG